MTNLMPCRVCGSSTAWADTGIVGNGNVRLLECETCTTVVVEQEPDSKELLSLYNDLFQGAGYGGGDNSLRSTTGSYDLRKLIWFLLLSKIERTVSGRKIVEIGGGTGVFGEYVTQRGWQYVNYDISEVAVAKVKKRGLTAYSFDPAEAPPLPPKSADSVVMLDVIEHIWLVYDYLNAVVQCLVPSGILVIKTPNYLKRGYKRAVTQPGWDSPPILLNFFTEKSLANVFTRVGFSHYSFFHRRVYRAKPWAYALKIAFGLEPEPNIYAIASK